MKELIQGIGFLIRVPFFIAILAFITCLGIPLMLLVFAFNVVVIPWVFITAAFKNTPDEFTEHMTELLPIRELLDAYSESFRWLQRG